MTLLDTPATDVQATFGHQDYLALNAALNEFTTDEQGRQVIPFEKDHEAVRAYFLNHINTNLYNFLDLEEKINFLVDHNYYEAEYIAKYDFAFIKKLYKQVYAHKYRFPSFMGAYKFYTSYAMKTFDGTRYLERFEDRIATVALYLADGDTKQAEHLAEEMITGRFQPATPTFMNSGKKQRGELVSCFLIAMEDNLNSIFRTINSAAQLSKRGGGVAICLSNLRGANDPIKQIQNQSSGIFPVLKLLEDTAKYVDQLGQRQGAFAAYISAFHIDIATFLDSKRENADEAARVKSLSLGVMVPDILFDLARRGDEMYVFSPYDVEREYGKQFAYINITEEYHRMVDNPRIRRQKIKGGARGFLTQLAETQLESGYPYVIFEDAANRNNPNSGKIIMSNLCTEIFQTTEPSELRDDQTYAKVGKDISCNLGSINMLHMLHAPNFGASIETMIRALTQVSDFSDIGAVPTIAEGNRRSHAIGLGVMNVHSTFGHYEIDYGSRESLDLTNAYFQLVTYHALRASNQIARERKATYDGFETSTYKSGAYFTKFTAPENQHLYTVKTAKVQQILDENGLVLPTLADWEELAKKVQRYGLYNAYLQAIAPTGSISYITNSSPSAMPITARMETRKEGKLGSVSYPAPEMNMHNITHFKTAYEIPVEHSIDLYSVLMWYVDQSASLTLHFPAGSGPRDVTKAQLYAFGKGKPSSMNRDDERQRMLNEFPQGLIKSLYYYRIQASILQGLQGSSVGAASFDECVACAI